MLKSVTHYLLSGVIRKENTTNRYLLTDGYNADPTQVAPPSCTHHRAAMLWSRGEILTAAHKKGVLIVKGVNLS